VQGRPFRSLTRAANAGSSCDDCADSDPFIPSAADAPTTNAAAAAAAPTTAGADATTSDANADDRTFLAARSVRCR
jgi:hypothetical protein